MSEIQTLQHTIITDKLINVKNLSTADNILCGIYLIYNKLNSKIYIGQSKNIYKRWKTHCEQYSENRKHKHRTIIDNAIAKHSEDNFECFVLEIFPEDQERLNTREAYWAEVYSECYLPTGYNNKKCGDQNGRILESCIEVSNYNDNGDLIETFEAVSDAIVKYGNNILSCIKEKNWYHKGGGYYWRIGHAEHIDLSNIQKLKTGPNGGKIIYRYNRNTGEYIDNFKSGSTAAQAINKYPKGTSNIQNAAAGKIRSVYNYYWSYEYVNNIFDLHPDWAESSQKYKWKKIFQYDLNGNLIATYENQIKAAEAIGVPASYICAATKGYQRTVKGYIWKSEN